VLTATLARLALVNQDYNLAESRLLALLNIPEQDTPEHRMLLAMAYVGAEQWSQALEAATAAIDARAAAGLLPVENWLLLLASIHYSLDDPGAMRDVMAEIVLLWPREKHLMNLAALHGQLGDPDRQLALVEAMIDEGRVLQQQNLVLLSGLFLSQGLPFKAAVLLETHLDDGSIEARQEHLERLSQAWFLAAEPQKAIPPLEQAAAMADNGELYMRVARLYLDNQDWQAADQAAAAALERGGLAAEGEAWLLRGMAMAGLEKYADARRHFERAMAEDDSARFAEQWLLYIEREQERAEMLSVEGGV
jgi:tetratricopeptide (TPR) repeat protein